jgi:SynChlorMet cassette protein ScmD
MQLNDRPVANPIAVLREEFDDWAVLFNPDTAEALGTNPVGVAIWKQMDGNHTLAEIVASVQKNFSRTPENVYDEVNGFIGQLMEKGFVGLAVEGGEQA